MGHAWPSPDTLGLPCPRLDAQQPQHSRNLHCVQGVEEAGGVWRAWELSFPFLSLHDHVRRPGTSPALPLGHKTFVLKEVSTGNSLALPVEKPPASAAVSWGHISHETPSRGWRPYWPEGTRCPPPRLPLVRGRGLGGEHGNKGFD